AVTLTITESLFATPSSVTISSTSACLNVIQTVGIAKMISKMIGIVAQIISSLWLPATCFGTNSSPTLLLRLFTTAIVNVIATVPTTSNIIEIETTTKKN